MSYEQHEIYWLGSYNVGANGIISNNSYRNNQHQHRLGATINIGKKINIFFLWSKYQ
jgi:hypothetical protein